MAGKIDSIRISSFRGATAPVTLRFEDRPVVVIFGENGTGKSTVADAFDLICNKEACGSLSGYSIPGSTKYVPSVGRPLSAITVELVAGAKTWTASASASGISVTPTDTPDAQILRRRTILRLIEGKPKDRYEALKELIDVPKIEAAETSLRTAYKSANDGLTQSSAALSQAVEALDKLWTTEGSPGSSAREWAEAERSKNVVELRSSVTEAEVLEQRFAQANGGLASLNQAAERLSLAREKQAAAERRRAEVESKAPGQTAELLDLLRESHEFVTTHPDASECPVCEQTTEPKKLASRLGSRIASMQDLADSLSALETASRVVAADASAEQIRREDFLAAASSLADALGKSGLALIVKAKADVERLRDAISLASSGSHDIGSVSQILTALGGLRTAVSTAAEANRKSIALHGAVTTQLTTIESMETTSKELEKTSKSLKALWDLVSNRRKAHVDGILEKIGTDVERLYSQLHPGESLGGVRFFLKPSAIGSLEFDANFHTAAKVPPQAYYSESHLDTLGICVFLARAKLFKTADTLIVLDDVLTSVDAPHLGRFMSMLHDEAANFSRIVVLTHFRPWRDQYRWAKGPAANTQVIELGPWALPTGISAHDFRTDLDALRASVTATPFDRQAVASKAGIALEFILDFLTLRYRSKMPRNSRGEYTLGELSSAMDGKLLAALSTRRASAGGAVQQQKLKPLIEEATKYTWVRNAVGSHFSVSGAAATDVDVLQFGKAVVALADALVCPVCRALPARRPSGSFWQCNCKSNELVFEPLVAPGADPSTVDDEM